ncbi:MAG: murein transglycosylase A [Candidatus Sedimenticola endophacoides]
MKLIPNRLTIAALLLILVWLPGCTLLMPREAGIGQALSWEALPGWREDDLSQAWPALLSQCRRLASEAAWEAVCRHAEALPAPSPGQARHFFQTHFQPHRIIGTGGAEEGLITGYYEPRLRGSLTPDSRYAHPLYGRPESLLTVDLAELFPELKGKRVRGRLVGNRVVPFFDRSEIDTGPGPLKGSEILWVDDPHDAFFLQIQGSGRVELPDGSTVQMGYADQNGHPYVSIGKRLIEWGELQREEVSLPSIRAWLRANPRRATGLLNENPSYVFFTLREDRGEGPRGSLNVPLTRERSAAVDRAVIPLGTPIWLSTTLPGEGAATPYRRLLFAQDTGGAINGPVRADVFFGDGTRAERLAGNMKQPGRLFALLPRQTP